MMKKSHLIQASTFQTFEHFFKLEVFCLVGTRNVGTYISHLIQKLQKIGEFIWNFQRIFLYNVDPL